MRFSWTVALLAAAPFALAQDRASVERYIAAYDRAIVKNDEAWFIAHLDSTGKVIQGGQTMTRADLVKMSAANKGKSKAPIFSSSKTTIDSLKIIGKQATVDFTSRMTFKGNPKPIVTRGHAVAVWKNGDWRILLVTSK